LEPRPAYPETLSRVGSAEGIRLKHIALCGGYLGLAQPRPIYQQSAGYIFILSKSFSIYLNLSFMFARPQVANAMTTSLPVGSSPIVTSFNAVVPYLLSGVKLRERCWRFGWKNEHYP